MQAFSGMQRNRTNLQFVKFLVFTVFLIFYQIITGLYPYLPPLVGVFFVAITVLNYEHDNKYIDFDYRWYLGILYLIFAEQFHGFNFFSIIITYVIFYFFIFDWLLKTIKFRNLLIIFCIFIAYSGMFLTSNFISYITKNSYLNFGYEYVIYFIIESAIAIFLFKGKIL